MSTPRLTVRVRLTLLYTALFVACGASIVAITYALVAALPAGSPTPTARELQQLRVFAACMRAHGIDVADPTPDGNLAVGGRLRDVTRAQLEADPAYMAAREGCRDQQPDLAPCPMEDEQQRTQCKEAVRQGATFQRDTTLAHLLRYSLITLAAATLLAGLAGWIVAGRVLRPVHRITAAAQAASEHNLSARVGLDGPRDELRELADTFDSMLGRLQAAFESQRRFTANAGHELRTPLTVMRTTLDVVLAKPAATNRELRAMGQDVRVAVDHADRLIDSLLTLSRSERGLTVHEPVDLATIAEDVLDLADPTGPRLHSTLEPALTSGDPVLLERLIANLVDNALGHNVPDGHVWVTTSTVAGRASLVVANTGPVIPDHALLTLFEPFQRLQERLTGHGFGLGLAIVASITTAHHGSVDARPRPGGGLTVTVTMPPPSARDGSDG
ncbi:sensor histidine kinase [Catellatospora citrea]|uniref:histidine kinase n=1 Tax=Catellatospora citrea TaxID=53366 RepID=A0A8J3KMZ3_9ACTN|nr:HAMP domain-containing sensor histidine kinase [Catellatospora citrea]RKE12182.1 signal transduction histidine kinase [Catellatospora citrea]GIF98854.1 sensor protein CutS [Catellatospora citrea]